MLRGVVYRLIESLAPMGHSSIWKLICAISVCNTLTVGVHLPSTPSVSGPGSATADPYGKAVSLRISGEYAANNWRTALFAVIVRNIFTSYREYPANKTGQSKK